MTAKKLYADMNADELKSAREQLDGEWDTLDFSEDYHLPEDLERLRADMMKRNDELEKWEAKAK